MSGSTRAAGSVLGANALGTGATLVTGSHHWLIATCAVTVAIGGISYGMSLIARHYR